ncbi:MAG: GNAT family protein [Marivibrio sp.]|uniref:GNAT family N-acetyltransferase n=1 Tax=Marivibrio sp. TaxID=2039719 RepID=UPI0032EE9B1D
MELRTPNFRLRSLTVEDVGEKYVSWLCDPDVVKWLNARFRSHTRDSIRQYVAGHDNRDSYHLGIFAAGAEHIGNFSVYIDRVHEVAQINVMIGDKKWWGRGVVLECRRAVIDWLFRDEGVYKIFGTPFVNNAAAVFNYKKQGFKLEGVWRAHRKISETERWDVAQFALFRDDWLSKEPAAR